MAQGLAYAGSTEWDLPEFADYFLLFRDYGNLTQAGFTNVNQFYYWSDTQRVFGQTAIMFCPGCATSSFPGQLDFGSFLAVAVRPADVTASVPKPQTLALALLALGATVVARRRRSC